MDTNRKALPIPAGVWGVMASAGATGILQGQISPGAQSYGEGSAHGMGDPLICLGCSLCSGLLRILILAPVCDLEQRTALAGNEVPVDAVAGVLRRRRDRPHEAVASPE